MNHEDYSHMQKQFKMANYLLGIVCIIALFVGIFFSCTSTKNICKEPLRLNGEVIYAIPAPQHKRTVLLKTDFGTVIIYRVPMEQPLVNIPVCTVHGKYYWVMP